MPTTTSRPPSIALPSHTPSPSISANATAAETVVMPSGASVQLMVPVAPPIGSRASVSMGVAEGT